MTDVDQLEFQMESSPRARRQLALEILKARRVAAALKSHYSRLPHQVQTALRQNVAPQQIGPDMPGAPGLALEVR